MEKVNFEKIDYKSKFGEKEKIFDMDHILIDKAYTKLQDMYNYCEQQRKFVQHLIKAFLPLDMWHRMMLVDKETRCAVLGYKVTGIHNVSECYGKAGTKRMLAVAHANVDGRNTLTEDEISDIKSVIKEYPIEIQKCRIGVCSESSNKYMMLESIIALQDVAEQINFYVESAFDKMLKEQAAKHKIEMAKPLVERIQIKVETNYAMRDKLDSKSLNKLLALKEYISNGD